MRNRQETSHPMRHMHKPVIPQENGDIEEREKMILT